MPKIELISDDTIREIQYSRWESTSYELDSIITYGTFTIKQEEVLRDVQSAYREMLTLLDPKKREKTSGTDSNS